MEMVTVRKLIAVLVRKAKKDPSILDKGIILSDDEEGNGYHGCYFTLTSSPKAVKGVLKASNGCREEVDPTKVVIIG